MRSRCEAEWSHCTMASAPGKVLITGAYLVLEQPSAGLVLSTSARFYAIVKPIHSVLPEDAWSWSWGDVIVVSPQLFKETPYKLSLRDFSLRKVNSSDGGSSFVEQAVQSAASAARCLKDQDEKKRACLQEILVKGLEITILGANDFYSYRKQLEARGLPLLASTLAALPPFSPIVMNPSAAKNSEIALPEVAKTGLGSSAAMTTAVVAALLHYLGAVDLRFKQDDSEEMKQALDLIHAVSQAAHCAAQGKIGSGFDVSTAVYGSQRYVRFSPSILSPAEGSANAKSALDTTRVLLSKKWDGEQMKYALPPLLGLIVGEPGFGGSHTPSMVGAVQKWRRQFPQDAQLVWEKLANANNGVETGLLHTHQVSNEYRSAYVQAINIIASSPAEKWQELCASDAEQSKVAASLLETRKAFLEVRSLLQRMGESAGVPVEPPSQTALLDATMAMDGVLLAGVPGAGGFDAVFAITVGDAARTAVEKEWSSRGVLSLCVFEDSRGVRLEQDDHRISGLTAGVRSLQLS